MYCVHLYGLHVYCALVDLGSSGCPCVRTTPGLTSSTQVVCLCVRAYTSTHTVRRDWARQPERKMSRVTKRKCPARGKCGCSGRRGYSWSRECSQYGCGKRGCSGRRGYSGSRECSQYGCGKRGCSGRSGYSGSRECSQYGWREVRHGVNSQHATARSACKEGLVQSLRPQPCVHK